MTVIQMLMLTYFNKQFQGDRDALILKLHLPTALFYRSTITISLYAEHIITTLPKCYKRFPLLLSLLQRQLLLLLLLLQIAQFSRSRVH